ncbi:MAG: hypothetical protein AAB212_01505, partial [Bacteroidota bacterium]
MKKNQWKNIVPHVIAVVVFLVVALVYCKPTLEGKVLQQHELIGSVNEQKDLLQQTKGKETNYQSALAITQKKAVE